MTELHRGNVILLKRPLADFIAVVTHVLDGRIGIRYMDSPPDDDEVVVEEKDVIKLADVQEKTLPPDFLLAIERQRQIVFAPKKKSKATTFKGVSDDTYGEILKILAEDNLPPNDEEGERRGQPADRPALHKGCNQG